MDIWVDLNIRRTFGELNYSIQNFLNSAWQNDKHFLILYAKYMRVKEDFGALDDYQLVIGWSKIYAYSFSNRINTFVMYGVSQK